jgi:predicted PurR-regulated permease PerM
MNHHRIQLIFFSLFIFAVLALNFFIFLPYLSILFLGLVFAILFAPLHETILKFCNGRRTLAANLSVVVVFCVIVGPVSFLGTLLLDEASELYNSVLSVQEGEGLGKRIATFSEGLQGYFPYLDLNFLEGDAEVYLERGLSWFLSHFSVLFSGALKVIFGLFLMLLALFYFLRDGKKFLEALRDLSPLEDTYDKKIMARIVTAVNSVVRGHLVIGLLQGLLTGIGFALFGVPSPVIWGTIAAVASLVPTGGTALVIIPGILFVFFSSGIIFALGLTLWGVLAVGLIDNLLGPMLINRGIHIHPFLILLSALGGLAFFGPIGFIAGPVILALLFALLDIYPVIMHGKKTRQNRSRTARRI